MLTTNELQKKIRELKELQALIDQAQEEAETIKDQLKEHMTEIKAEEISVDVYKVRYTTVQSTRFDSKAFKNDAPTLYEQYNRPTITRRFVIA